MKSATNAMRRSAKHSLGTDLPPALAITYFMSGFAGTVAFIAVCWMLARTAGIAP